MAGSKYFIWKTRFCSASSHRSDFGNCEFLGRTDADQGISLMVDNMSQSIDHILTHRKILITCGTGGVGKTTLSAAIAIRAAMLGKKAVVITIDPAKRLANSLGLHFLGDQPTDLTPQ